QLSLRRSSVRPPASRRLAPCQGLVPVRSRPAKARAPCSISLQECELAHIARKAFVLKSCGSSLTRPGHSNPIRGRGSFVPERCRLDDVEAQAGHRAATSCETAHFAARDFALSVLTRYRTAQALIRWESDRGLRLGLIRSP